MYSTLAVVLAVQRHRLNTYGGRAFAVAGPMVWNSLPDFIRDPSISTDSFRRLLKTYICLRDTSACSALEVDNFMRYINLFTYLLTTQPLLKVYRQMQQITRICIGYTGEAPMPSKAPSAFGVRQSNSIGYIFKPELSTICSSYRSCFKQ